MSNQNHLNNREMTEIGDV